MDERLRQLERDNDPRYLGELLRVHPEIVFLLTNHGVGFKMDPKWQESPYPGTRTSTNSVINSWHLPTRCDTETKDSGLDVLGRLGMSTSILKTFTGTGFGTRCHTKRGQRV